MKKKIEFGEVKMGEYFKYYGVVYRKIDFCLAVPLTGKICLHKYIWNDVKVIPITVTIKVKEK